MRNVSAVLGCAGAVAVLLAQTPAALKTTQPEVVKVVEGISEKNIAATMQRLEQFETRNAFSDIDHPTHGVGAAARWIEQQFKSYSPRLEVRIDRHTAPKNGRVWRDVELLNVVAVLKGKVNPDREIVISGHYDSLHRIMQKTDAPAGPGVPPAEDHEATTKAIAPGVNDDGSGTAAVMEMARVMSQYEWDNTVVFIAFDGEEYGLLGSRAYAVRAKKEDERIEAVLNNDIIGGEVSSNGRVDNRSVNVFSAEPADSPSRALARYIREIGERYVPGMDVHTVFRADRFGRGGDHTPFEQNGFAAVRFTTPAEDLGRQHNEKDTFENSSPGYTTRVAKVNAAALATLALAPPPPTVTRTLTQGTAKGRVTPLLTRGTSRTDAVLKWSLHKSETPVAGYTVLQRSTIAPFWEKEIFVGNVNEYTFKDLNIDDCVLGVKAIAKNGAESLVSAYAITPAMPITQ